MAILTYEQVQAIMRQVGFPESEIVLGASIFKQESQFNTSIVNPGVGAGGKKTNEYSVGIGQINTLVHKNYTVEQLKNPVTNLTECLRIYKNDKDRNGNYKRWKSWGGYTDGGYKKYFAASQAAYKNGGGDTLKIVISDSNDQSKVKWGAVGVAGLVLYALFG